MTHAHDRAESNDQRAEGHRRKGQGGFTLLETMLSVSLIAMVMLPIFGWAFVASEQQVATIVRNIDGASVGLLRAHFLRDVASSTDAMVGGAAAGNDCTGGSSSASTPVDTVMVLQADSTKTLVYNRATSSKGDGTSIWRRECAAGALVSERELVRKIAPSSLVVTCGPRPTLPSTDCGRISLVTQTDGGQSVSMAASLRAGASVGIVGGGGGPIYISPDVSVTVSALEVHRGEQVTFDGTASIATGAPLTYHWELGDGTTATTSSVTHAYTQLGEFTAVFTATTPDGTPGTNFTRIKVTNRKPTAVISSPAANVSTYQCTPITFAGTGSNDSGDASYGGAIAKYHWDYGDGRTGTVNTVSHSSQFTNIGPNSGNSPLTVGLTVEDNDGGMSPMVSRDILVKNRLPNVPPITAQVQNGPLVSAGGNYTGTLPLVVKLRSNASDPDGSCDTLSYSWDLGGGQQSTAADPDLNITSGSSRTVKLTVTDEHGGSRTSQPITFTLNGPPTAAFTLNPTSVRTGVAVTVTNSSSDNETPASGLTYAWTFQHGNQDGTNSTSGLQNPGTVKFSHNQAVSDTFAPASPGEAYTVTLTVTDPQGGTSTTTRTVNVTGAPAPTNLAHSGFGCSGWFCAGSRTGTMSWSAVSNVDRYQVRLECEWLWCGTNYTLETAGLSITQSGLPSISGDYKFRVRARDSYSGRWGTWSSWHDI